MSDIIIGVDLGGTRIRVAQFDKQLHIIKRLETPTLAHEGLDATLGRIKEQIARIMPEDKSSVKGIGISAPGPLDPNQGTIINPPNLPGWEEVPLAAIIQKEFAVPVLVGNDANVAALAEAARGNAKGYNHAIYLTISTGIGSGIIIDGRLLLGRQGLGAEAGHMMMLVGDKVSSFELECAGPDMAMKAAKRIEAGEASILSNMVNGQLDQIDGKILGDAAKQGDKLAIDVITRSGKIVGLGIVTLLHLFNPDIIIIGGGASNMGDLLFKPMQAAIKHHAIADKYWKDLIITSPALGEDACLVGSAVLVATDGGIKQISEIVEQIGQ